MKIFKSVEQLNRDMSEPVGVVIGNFDGVHLGHQHLLQKFISACNERHLAPVVLTLAPHPHIFFKGKNCGSILNLPSKKSFSLEKVGINNLFEIDFTPEIQSMGALEFIKTFILKINQLKLVTLGHDFALGNGKEDARGILKKEAPGDLLITQVDSFEVGGEPCSSTRIRKLLASGSVSDAAKLLGENYSLPGIVRKGNGNGSAYLVPTANVEIDSSLMIPKTGVYYTNTLLGNKSYVSITNIGYNPTIDKNLPRTIESHFLDFSESIYGEEVEVIFLGKCRDEKKFEKLAELKEEILRNIEQRRDFRC